MTAALGLVFAAATAARAQLIYPHSPSEEKATTEVAESLALAKTAHLAAIDRHRTFLDEAIARERQIIVGGELAHRDRSLLELMDRFSRDPADGRAELGAEVRSRIVTLTGLREQNEAIPALRLLDLNLGIVGDRRAHIDDRRQALQRAIRAFEAAGGEGDYCNSDGVGDAAGPRVPGGNPNLFASIKLTCENIRKDLQSIGSIQTGVITSDPVDGPIVAAILGDRALLSRLSSSSTLREAMDENDSLQRLADAQQALTRAAAKRLKDLQELHRCELRRAADSGSAGRIQEAARALDEFSRWLAAPQEATGATPANPPPQSDVRPSESCRAPSPWPQGGLFAVAGVDRAQFQSALIQVGRLDPMRAIWASVQAEAQDFRAGRLGEVLSALADPSASPGQQSDGAIAASLLGLIRHAERLNAAQSHTLPNTSGILVQLAAARMQQSTANIEAERLQSMLRMSRLRVAALMQELDMLRQAHNQLRGTNPSFERALVRYSSSWEDGRIPAAVLRQDMTNVAYTSWSQRERVVVEAAYAALEPAAAELQTYGAGGIRASEIAQYLNVLGLGAIAWTN